MNFETPNILFLKGVFLKDCESKYTANYVDDIVESIDMLSESSEGDSDDDLDIELTQQKIHQTFLESEDVEFCEIDMSESDSINCFIDRKIPKYFYDMETWVKTTALKCWSCDCRFSNIPCFIPLNYNRILTNPDNVDAEERRTIDVYGNFCSFNCAVYYIRDVKDSNMGNAEKRWEKYEMLKLLYKEFNGKSITEIQSSPPKTCMIQYGGDKTVEDYRKLIAGLDKSYEETKRHSSLQRFQN